MSFIPEWVSFQNDVRTAFTWQNRPTQPSWKRPFYPPSWKWRNGVRFQFTWYQNEMSYQNENFIWIENWNELIPEWLVRLLTFVSVSFKQIQRNIWGWNELVLEWKSLRYPVNGSWDESINSLYLVALLYHSWHKLLLFHKTADILASFKHFWGQQELQTMWCRKKIKRVWCRNCLSVLSTCQTSAFVCQ